MLGSTRRFSLMRKPLTAVGILLAVLCAWLVFSQPKPDLLNAGEGSQVQEESSAQLAPEVQPGEFGSSEAAGAEANHDASNPELRREAVGELPEGMAEIGVQVLQAKSSQALMSIEVRAQRAGGIGSTFGDFIQPIESAQTGRSGEAVLRVPAGVALSVSAGGPGMSSIILSPAGEVTDLEYEEVSQEVEALQPGEKINLVLRLSEVSHLHWFRLVDGSSGAALPEVRVREPFVLGQQADENALISIAETNDFYGRPVVIFEMQGYGPRRVYLDEGGDTPERALQVELFQAASLRLTVLQNGQPLAGARIAMHYARSDGEIEEFNRAHWGGKPRKAPFWGDTDQQGVVWLQELPAYQPLVYGVSKSFGTDISQRAPEPVVLKPGEQGEQTWEVGHPHDLRGRAIDADGSPVVGVDVWLLDSRFQHGVEIDQASVSDWAEHYRLAVCETNASGEFVFEQVDPGNYWVALAPTDDGAQLATARRVHVPPLASPPLVELQFSDGVMVRGRCVTLTGEAIADMDFFAMGMEGRAMVQGKSDADGRFEVGPFAAGSTVEFFVFPNTRGYQIAEPVRALAGDGHEVYLRLAKGGTIRGRAVNHQNGEPIEIDVTVSSKEAGGASGTKSGSNGEFSWSGLAPGTWRVIAKNTSGWVGMSEPIVLHASEVVEDVEVRVAPGGSLVIESEGSATGTLRLRFEGWTVDFVSIGAGERKAMTVPVGEIEISLLNGEPNPPTIGTVHVSTGRTETFALKPNE